MPPVYGSRKTMACLSTPIALTLSKRSTACLLEPILWRSHETVSRSSERRVDSDRSDHRDQSSCSEQEGLQGNYLEHRRAWPQEADHGNPTRWCGGCGLRSRMRAGQVGSVSGAGAARDTGVCRRG